MFGIGDNKEPKEENVFITQFICYRCKIHTGALFSRENNQKTMQEYMDKGNVVLCENCYNAYKVGVTLAMRDNVVGVKFSYVNPDGSIDTKKGFIDK